MFLLVRGWGLGTRLGDEIGEIESRTQCPGLGVRRLYGCGVTSVWSEIITTGCLYSVDSGLAVELTLFTLKQIIIMLCINKRHPPVE